MLLVATPTYIALTVALYSSTQTLDPVEQNTFLITANLRAAYRPYLLSILSTTSISLYYKNDKRYLNNIPLRPLRNN